MDEQIITAVVRGDESESLVFIEPLYRTCIQVFFSLAQNIGPTSLTALFLTWSATPKAKGALLTTGTIKAWEGGVVNIFFAGVGGEEQEVQYRGGRMPIEWVDPGAPGLHCAQQRAEDV